jgi:hypothetical protein
MSTDARADEMPEPLPHDREDGATELDQRATFQVLFYDPTVRNFTFAALGALGMIFLILFQQNSDIGGLLVVIIGVCGLLLRWTAAPAFLLLVLTYFMWTPVGIPGEGYEDPYEIDYGWFRVIDVLLVMSVLVYLACQYRIYGLVYQAVSFEGPIRRKDELPTRRPAALVRPAELGILIGVCAAFVIAGQLIWWFANAVEIAPAEDFPLKWAEAGRTVQRPMQPSVETPGGLNTGATRFVVLVGLLFFGTLVARLVFGYWRLRMMGAAEGGMILLDGGWSETSRERQRVEKWRIWGRQRAEEQAMAAEKAKTGGKP